MSQSNTRLARVRTARRPHVSRASARRTRKRRRPHYRRRVRVRSRTSAGYESARADGDVARQDPSYAYSTRSFLRAASSGQGERWSAGETDETDEGSSARQKRCLKRWSSTLLGCDYEPQTQPPNVRSRAGSQNSVCYSLDTKTRLSRARNRPNSPASAELLCADIDVRPRCGNT